VRPGATRFFFAEILGKGNGGPEKVQHCVKLGGPSSTYLQLLHISIHILLSAVVLSTHTHIYWLLSVVKWFAAWSTNICTCCSGMWHPKGRGTFDFGRDWSMQLELRKFPHPRNKFPRRRILP
jgi:hypothetical protein